MAKVDLSKVKDAMISAGKKTVEKIDMNFFGSAVIDEMKDGIAKGISPIKGRGRFPAYKHAGVKNKYPDSVKNRFKGKRQRPVNLFLSGDFLSKLKFKIMNRRVVIGFFDEKSRKKELGHREGANSQPLRPVIPADNESFSDSIMRRIFKSVKFRT